MKTEEKDIAIKFRKSGLTYQEILARLPVSKGSLSYWLRDIGLTDAQKARIYGKALDVRKDFVIYNDLKRREAVAHKSSVFNTAKAEINSVSKPELWLIGTALYWAEGYKSDKATYVEFVNSDPHMVCIMMRWFRDICGVPEYKFRIRIQIHGDKNIENAHAFWSSFTRVPIKQFTKPYIRVSPTSKGKTDAVLTNGVCHIRISDINLLTKIKGWIKGLSGAIV